jgi:hypothetical protein
MSPGSQWCSLAAISLNFTFASASNCPLSPPSRIVPLGHFDAAPCGVAAHWEDSAIDSMEDVRIRFGKAMRKRRKRLGLSQEEFADKCALDRSYMGGLSGASGTCHW